MKPAQICPACQHPLRIERLRCEACQTTVEGRFGWPRLARLAAEDQQLVELLLLASGSLKAVAKQLGISYPTMRKRLDALIEQLELQVKHDEQQRRQLLKDVAAGKRSAAEAARQIREST
jgi:hypothetical protein